MRTGEVMQWRGRRVVPGSGPFVVGILNLTPDSFSDGGDFSSFPAAIEAGCRMADEGADCIDIGGESTRPGSRPVSAEEQIRRVLPVLSELARRFAITGPAISIDTRSAEVARAAIEAGATTVNDVSALRFDPAMAGFVAERGLGVVLMHAQGSPADMQDHPTYHDVVTEVREFLAERIAYAVKNGIARERIIVDPGIGFGKRTVHNLKILGQAAAFRELGCPMMIGPSRKRFIGRVLNINEPKDRDTGTLGAVAACVLAGVECVRVHHVAACRQVVDLCAAIRRGTYE